MSDSAGLRVTIDDARLAGYCSRGTKKWFDSWGLDFRDFLRNGIEADRLLATGCPCAEHVVRLKRERNAT